MTPAGDSAKARQEAHDVFEDWAEHYATQREHLPYFQAQVRHVRHMLRGKVGRVLDVGCAAGAEIQDLRSQGFSAVGIDLAPTMLEFGKRRFRGDGKVHFCQADVEALPFASASMDHVVCLGVFEFLRDYSVAVAEIYRVLRPGGLAVFAIPSSISVYVNTERAANAVLRPVWRVAKRLLRRGSEPEAPAFKRTLCVPWRFRALLKTHNLLPKRVAYTNYFLYPLDLFPALHVKVAELLEPLAGVPLLRCGASVYLVAAQKSSD